MPGSIKFAATALVACPALAVPLGGNQSYAYGINGRREVAGRSWPAGSQTAYAHLYRNGRMTEGNALIDPAGGWELLEARGIDESGPIAGRGRFDGRALACRLDPVPTATPPPLASAEPPPTPNPAHWLCLVSDVSPSPEPPGEKKTAIELCRTRLLRSPPGGVIVSWEGSKNSDLEVAFRWRQFYGNWPSAPPLQCSWRAGRGRKPLPSKAM